MPLEETLIDQSSFKQNHKDISGAGISVADNRIEIETKILHKGEVNRARFMPQQHNIIASKTVEGEVHIFDYTKHPTKPKDDNVKPNLKLTGHKGEGYGLSWNRKKQGYLLSGSHDSKICIWDIEAKAENSLIKPLQEYFFHKGNVEDVAWHNYSPDLFASVGEDRTILLWDTKENKKSPTNVINGHLEEINTIDFSPFNEYLFLTGSSDKTIGIWDLRNTSKRLHTFEGHTSDVIYSEIY